MSESVSELERIATWLTTPATDADRAQFEADCADRCALGGVREQEVREFRAALAGGCELWRFHSPSSTIRRKVARAGWAAVRDGTAVAFLVTAMS